MDTNDLQMLAESGALNPEQLREVKALLLELHMERISTDSDQDAMHRLAEAGLPLVGPAPAPRERSMTGMDALRGSGVPIEESETVQLADLPFIEQLAALDGIGDQRAFELAEATGIPLRGGHSFLGAERDLRAAFGERDENLSADDLLCRLGVPMMREARPAHETAKLLDQLLPGAHPDREHLSPIIRAGAAVDGDQRTQLAALAVKHAGLLEGQRGDISDLKDAEDGEDITDAIRATIGESEARGVLAAGGVPLRQGALA